MDANAIDQALTDATTGLRLLEHPFYRRWEAGELLPGELADYAAQYRHFEAMLPRFLERLADALPAGGPRDAVTANLDDERGDPVPHLELFDRFASALGAGPAAPTPATAALLGSYDRALAGGPVSALCGLVAYERQAPEVASSKAAGLRAHYDLDDEAIAFWDHHATVDVAHARWSELALVSLDAPPPEVAGSARRVAEAWWAFLDEREAVRPAA